MKEATRTQLKKKKKNAKNLLRVEYTCPSFRENNTIEKEVGYFKDEIWYSKTFASILVCFY